MMPTGLLGTGKLAKFLGVVKGCSTQLLLSAKVGLHVICHAAFKLLLAVLVYCLIISACIAGLITYICAYFNRRLAFTE
jgi:hypothetical protein